MTLVRKEGGRCQVPRQRLHRRDRLAARDDLAAAVAGLPVPVLTGTGAVAAHGNGSLAAIDVADKRSREVSRLSAQAVVSALGFTADMGRATPATCRDPLPTAC